jgi:D-lactate dehydrogenase
VTKREAKGARLRPAALQAWADRAPQALAAGTPTTLLAGLTEAVGAAQVRSRVTDLVRYATDASPYRLIPQAVIVARDVTDVAAVMSYASTAGRSIVFRAGGTSLSGQAQSDDILVDVRQHWSGAQVLDDGRQVRVRPGTTIGQVNLSLRRHGRALGPDPASSAVACIGGVVANNSSGMAAGTTHNAYRTVRSMTFVLVNGTVVDTATPDAEAVFAQGAPDLTSGLMDIKAEIEADPALSARIRQKYAIKNTSGYRLDAFLDGTTPVEIFRRLLVGSQGTLGFIAEVVFDTVPLGRLHATGLLLFPSLEAAAEAVPAFVDAGARAVEMMDSDTIRLSADRPNAPPSWATLPEGACGLLVEFRANDSATLAGLTATADEFAARLPLLEPAEFTTDDRRARFYWRVRENLMAGLGKSRPAESTLIVEDVCVPPTRIAEASRDVSALLVRHGYPGAVAGHAAAGNLHFILALNSASEPDRRRYQSFMTELVELILSKYDGSLKAEHGTGRNMTPFVELEWGATAAALMWRVKELADPLSVLGRGVLLNRDPAANMRHLKTMPTVEAAVDACFECGFCEQVCPSRDITTTPRQRIALRREMRRQPDGSPVQSALLDDYVYDAVDTCAGDGTCALACPVDIDTGALMKQFRHRMNSDRAEAVALSAARHWAQVERTARAGLAAGATLGDRAMTAATAAGRRVLEHELAPAWSSALPGPARPLPATSSDDAAAVYFPACVNRIFGSARSAPHSRSLPAAVVAVSERAGRPVWIPEDVHGVCCATVWHSKGYERGNEYMARRALDRLWAWTDGGQRPVVVDAASCTLGLASEIVPYLDPPRRRQHEHITFIDSVTWAAQLAPRLTITRRVDSATVHATCSMRHLGVDDTLVELVGQLADNVLVPEVMTCCGFAGDRGLLHPELTAAATRREAAQVTNQPFDAYISANRTCEIGMESATGAPYESVLFLLERATCPRQPQGAQDD